jgi:hypothetical protein
MKAKKVKFTVIPSDSTEMMVIIEDGSIATCYHNGSHILTEYYQNRIDKETIEDENFWDKLADGNIYCKDWKNKQIWDNEIINDMLKWLYCSTDPIEFTKCNLNFETLNNFIK